jgi:hypothetical protein
MNEGDPYVASFAQSFHKSSSRKKGQLNFHTFARDINYSDEE